MEPFLTCRSLGVSLLEINEDIRACVNIEQIGYLL